LLKIARDELKASRAIQKIEEAKKNGMWSLKQHKKHRAIARTKTHWDSLIDEMVCDITRYMLDPSNATFED
jgi:hypothetical protein